MKLKENRQLFRNAGEILEATEKVDDKVIQGIPWIRFAKQLNFTDAGKDVYPAWKEIEAMKPKFVTALDVAVAKKIYEWLTCPDADAVLDGSKPTNYVEVVERFRAWDIDGTITKKDLVDKDLNGIEELVKLKSALKELQAAAQSLFHAKK